MRRAGLRLQIVFAGTVLIFLALVMIAPVFYGLSRSFDANGLSLANYRKVLSDGFFWRAAANNIILPVASLIVEFAVGLLLALFLTSSRRTSTLIQAAAILPFAIPEIVLLSLARYIFMPRGYLNGALTAAGFHSLPWLAPNHPLALGTVVLVDAWHVTPIVMLILMAGLRTIPPELYEAAMLDGAGRVATFRFVTLPMLRPALVGALVLRGVDALRIFSTTLVLTGIEGVPVISTYAYQLYTDAQEPNVAMAASMLLAVLITAFGVVGFALSRQAAGAQEAF